MQGRDALFYGGLGHGVRGTRSRFYISFSGIVTFSNAAQLQNVARRVPAERLLVETDAPYLSPMPMRGKRNEPAFVRHTAEFIAQLRKEPVETIAEQTTENFFRLFKKAKKRVQT